MLTTKTTKRKHTVAFKRKLVGLSEQPGASVAATALENGINANLLFKWRRLQLGRPTSTPSRCCAVMLPVTIEPMPPVYAASNTAPPPGVANATRASFAGVIEIELGGVRVRLRGAVDPDSVRCVLQTLRQAP